MIKHCDDVCLVREARAAIANEGGPGHESILHQEQHPIGDVLGSERLVGREYAQRTPA